MAVRQQQRRGTASQWATANPILAAAEIGFEVDTNKFKIGDGTNRWEDLVYFTADAAQAIQDLLDGAPGVLDTLNELAASLGDNPDFIGTMTTNLAAKAPLASPTFTGTVSGVTKGMVGLGAVDNTADSAKPVSTAQATAIATAKSEAISTAGSAADTKVSNAVAALTKSSVGLANVDNTSDANKPVSTATQTALDAKLASATAASTYETISNVALKAPLANPEFTGTPIAPTAAGGTNTTQVATTAFVQYAFDHIASFNLVLDGGGVA